MLTIHPNPHHNILQFFTYLEDNGTTNAIEYIGYGNGKRFMQYLQTLTPFDFDFATITRIWAYLDVINVWEEKIDMDLYSDEAEAFLLSLLSPQCVEIYNKHSYCLCIHAFFVVDFLVANPDLYADLIIQQTALYSEQKDFFYQQFVYPAINRTAVYMPTKEIAKVFCEVAATHDITTWTDGDDIVSTDLWDAMHEEHTHICYGVLHDEKGQISLGWIPLDEAKEEDYYVVGFGATVPTERI